jgi:RNA polymerase sigma factor (sigma-70 family)
MTDRSDAELLTRFQHGDDSAFNALVLRYQEKLYWVARRFVVHHDDADDVVQDVFVKAYHALKKFRGDSQLYTWLYRITVNHSLNTIRKNKLREIVRLDELLGIESSNEENPQEMSMKTEEQLLITKAIASLPEKQKAVFILRYYEELSYQEISDMLKITVGGLKANFFHAVRKIEAYVKNAHGSR